MAAIGAQVVSDGGPGGYHRQARAGLFEGHKALRRYFFIADEMASERLGGSMLGFLLQRNSCEADAVVLAGLEQGIASASSPALAVARAVSFSDRVSLVVLPAENRCSEF